MKRGGTLQIFNVLSSLIINLSLHSEMPSSIQSISLHNPGNLCGLSWVTTHCKTVTVPLNHTAKVNILDVHLLLGNEGPLQSQTLMYKRHTVCAHCGTVYVITGK